MTRFWTCLSFPCATCTSSASICSFSHSFSLFSSCTRLAIGVGTCSPAVIEMTLEFMGGGVPFSSVVKYADSSSACWFSRSASTPLHHTPQPFLHGGTRDLASKGSPWCLLQEVHSRVEPHHPRWSRTPSVFPFGWERDTWGWVWPTARPGTGGEGSLLYVGWNGRVWEGGARTQDAVRNHHPSPWRDLDTHPEVHPQEMFENPTNTFASRPGLDNIRNVPRPTPATQRRKNTTRESKEGQHDAPYEHGRRKRKAKPSRRRGRER